MGRVSRVEGSIIVVVLGVWRGCLFCFFFSSRRRHTRWNCDWSSDVCSSDLAITSPLIDKALTPPLPARIVFLVQAEVADRIAAPPGSKTYGALSVGVQAVARVERLFTVRAGAFKIGRASCRERVGI